MPPVTVDTAVLFRPRGGSAQVIRTGAQESEQLAGLPTRYAYDHPAYRLARVGVLTDQQWADDVTDRLACLRTLGLTLPSRHGHDVPAHPWPARDR